MRRFSVRLSARRSGLSSFGRCEAIPIYKYILENLYIVPHDALLHQALCLGIGYSSQTGRCARSRPEI